MILSPDEKSSFVTKMSEFASAKAPELEQASNEFLKLLEHLENVSIFFGERAFRNNRKELNVLFGDNSENFILQMDSFVQSFKESQKKLAKRK